MSPIPSRIIKLLLFLAVVAIVSYLYIQNPAAVTVVFSSSRSWTAPLALILTVTFSVGIILTAAIALYYAARSSFSRWLERRKFETEREHWRRITKVRELSASGLDDRAASALQRIITEDPQNLLARAMYAECLRKLNHHNEALMTLDEARASFSENVELPLTAAAIHLQRGNATAAYDNVQMVLQNDPNNKTALELAKSCAERLGYHAKAAEFTERYLRLSNQGTGSERELAEIHLRQINDDYAELSVERKKKLEAMTKQYREFAPAFEALADIEHAQGNREHSARLYARAFTIDGQTSHLEQLARTWLETHEPTKAVSAVRGLLLTEQDSTGFLPDAALFFVQLLLHLDMIEEAKKELQSLKSRADVSGHLSEQTRRDIAFVEARLLERHDKIEPALAVLLRQASLESTDPFMKDIRADSAGSLMKNRNFDAPSPRLSTP